jgi:hypothetical protein
MASKDYSKGKIYKIEPVNGEEGDIYIGSTCKELLSQRMTAHRSTYKRWKNGKATKVMSYTLFDKYGIENCVIVLIELVNAKCKDELHAREQHYIKSLQCVNKYIPLRTSSEYKKDNEEKYKEYFKQYNFDRRDETRVYKQEYQIKNKEEIKNKKISYREANKEIIRAKKKAYYEANKEAINAKRKELYRLQKDNITK